MGQDGARYIHRAEDIDVELRLDRFARNSLKDTKKALASVIDHGVNAPKVSQALLDSVVDAWPVLDVQSNNRHSFKAFETGTTCDISHGGDDVPASLRKRPDSSLSEPGRNAGDKNGKGHFKIVSRRYDKVYRASFSEI